MKIDEVKPLVYVIVLNWNGKHDTKECLDSLTKLTYSNFKVIVVDNNSSDGSVEFLKGLYPRVEFIENDSNLGFAKGNNVGIEYALRSKAEFIFLLNNDTVVSSDLLDKLVEKAEMNPRIGILGPKIYYYHQKNKIWFAGGKILYFLGNTWHLGNRRKDRGQYSKIKDVDYITGCALLIKHDVLEKIGLFDHRYSSYFEDCDLCVRTKREGYRIVCVQNAKMWHKVSASTGGGLTPIKAYYKIQSGNRFFKSYAHPIFYRTTILFFSLIYFFLIMCLETIKGNIEFDKAVIKGFYEILRRKDS